MGTDDEQLETGVNKCMYDLGEAEEELRLCGDFIDVLVKNSGIEERCADPSEYDRKTGLLK